MRIDVLQCDIDKAVEWAGLGIKYSRTAECPVAQALKRVFGRIASVGYESFILQNEYGNYYVADADIAAVHKVTHRDNDEWRHVVPFSFEVIQSDGHPVLPQPADPRS